MLSRKRIKELQQENDNLKKEIKKIERENVFINNANLPKCKSLACLSCEHFAYFQVPSGNIIFLGCGKGETCDCFSAKKEPISDKDRQLLQSKLLWQGQL